DDHALEFPQIDLRRTGRKHRYGYALHMRGAAGDVPGGAHGVLKYDLALGSVQRRMFEDHERCDEVVFVPASATAGEDEGYLLGSLFDQRTCESELLVLDAQNIEAAPLARVRVTQRVPFGFHGLWVPDRAG